MYVKLYKRLAKLQNKLIEVAYTAKRAPMGSGLASIQSRCKGPERAVPKQKIIKQMTSPMSLSGKIKLKQTANRLANKEMLKP